MRIIIVEDEPLIAEDLRWTIAEELGHDVAGIAATADDALALIAIGNVGGAVVDAHLSRGKAERVAEALRARGLPFFVLSGSIMQEALPSPLNAAPFLQKPYSEAELEACMHLLEEAATRR